LWRDRNSRRSLFTLEWIGMLCEVLHLNRNTEIWQWPSIMGWVYGNTVTLGVTIWWLSKFRMFVTSNARRKGNPNPNGVIFTFLEYSWLKLLQRNEVWCVCLPLLKKKKNYL
jgi:hypothetical protein